MIPRRTSLRSPHTIIAADWGKSARKRRAVRIDLKTLSVESVELTDQLTLESLVAISLARGTLIGIDAVFGIPDHIGRASGAQDFLDWLRHGKDKERFFEPACSAEEWDPWRPFWVNPHGEGSQTRFLNAIRLSHHGFPDGHPLVRKIDLWARGKPPTCVSGMPGTVGSGTLEIWKELAGKTALAVWPFSGASLETLLAGNAVVVEAYPAIGYSIALAKSLPAGRVSIAKTKRPHRVKALRSLTRSPAWAPELRIADDLWAAARKGEDDFDALFLGLGLCRLALERQLDPGPSPLGPKPDPCFEGGIVGSWCVVPAAPKGVRARAGLARSSTPSRSNAAPIACPIPGCGKVYSHGRGGWDGHVASVRKHREWHPEARDGTARKELFRAEFPAFFRL
jgi:hypothetical protein